MSAPPSVVGGESAVSGAPAIPPLELEHAIGFSPIRSGIHAIPGTTRYAHVVGGCVVISDTADEHFQLFLRGHDDDISSLRVSRSGQRLVTSQTGSNADVCVWDASEYRIVQRFSALEHGVLAVDISYDDSIVAAIGKDLRLTFFDVSNGGVITHTPLSTMMAPDETIRDARFGPKAEDEKRRETGCVHLCVITAAHVWPFQLNPFKASLQLGKVALSSFQRQYSAVGYSDHGDLMFVGSDAGDVATIKVAHGTVVDTTRVCTNGVRELVVVPSNAGAGTSSTAVGGGLPTAGNGGFRYARFGPGSERSSALYVGGGDGTVSYAYLADHGDPKLEVQARRSIGPTEPVRGLTLANAQEHRVLVGTAGGNTYAVQCDPTVKQVNAGVQRTTDALSSPLDVLVAHPSSPDTCVVAAHDGALRYWDLNSYRVRGTMHSCAKTEALPTCTGIRICEGLEVQLSSWTDRSVRCHDMTNFELLWTHAQAHRAPVTAIAVSRSMKFFATGSAEGDIKVWDMRTREQRLDLKDHKKGIVSLHVFEDDKHLVSASQDRTVVTWDLATGRRLTSHEAGSGPLSTMLLGRDQCSVFTAGADRQINQWDLRQREVVRSTPYSSGGSDAFCTKLASNHDDRLLLGGGTDQVVHLWDQRVMRNGEPGGAELAKGYGHSGTISDVAFTADSRQALSCGMDSAFLVWNVYV